MGVAFTLVMFLSMFALSSHVNFSFADEETKAQKKVQDALGEFSEEGDDFDNILDKVIEEYDYEDNYSFKYLMQRILLPGYINDVSYGVIYKGSKGNDPRVEYNGNKYTCNPDAPLNLLNHNCNVPNVMTEIMQSTLGLFVPQGVIGNKLTNARPAFGFGIPSNIPGGEVPVSPSQRQHKYTGLELYGYNLQYTSYLPEWDAINVSTSSRMLASFGSMDNLRAVGNSVWQGLRRGTAGLIESFDYNPLRFFNNVLESFEDGMSASFNSIVDTIDLNVIASGAWQRSNFDKTLYNVYTLSNKEILQESSTKYTKTFTDIATNLAAQNPELQEALKLDTENLPTFTYDPEWETDESIEAHKKWVIDHERWENDYSKWKQDVQAWETKKAEIDAMDPTDPDIIIPVLGAKPKEPIEPKEPKPVYYTEQEQFGFWKDEDDVNSMLTLGDKHGLYKEDAKNYSELQAHWAKLYPNYKSQTFNAQTLNLTDLFKSAQETFFSDNVHNDPSKQISKYVCADENGKPIREDNGSYRYLYKKENSGSEEFVNSCGEVRPVLGSGLFGNGWHVDTGVDTRTDNLSSSDGLFSYIVIVISDKATNLIRSISAFNAKLTNIFVSLSFTNVFEALGIVGIVESLLESFRDTVFFPLASLAAAAGALSILFDIVRQANYAQAFKTFLVAVLVFITGIVLLTKPGLLLDMVEKVPLGMENYLADKVLTEGDNNKLCSTGSEEGVRAVQCQVWNLMVFQPWVNGQFGTSYDNLYANGYAPENGLAMENKNGSLVGDASVNMGGGVTENNWALYQLDITKKGTVTTNDNSVNKRATAAKDIYRLVDLQAGPNGGELSDTRYWDTWTGDSGARWRASLLGVLQSIIMGIIVVTLSFHKISYSLIFAIYLIFIPIMLLFGFSSKGQVKLGQHALTMVSILMKRIMSFMLLLIYLVFANSVMKNSSANSGTVFLGILLISAMYILYRKEIINLLSFGNDMEDVIKGNIDRMTPQSVKTWYSIQKAGAVGNTAGYIAASTATMTQKQSAKAEYKNTKVDIDRRLEQGEINASEARYLELQAKQAEEEKLEAIKKAVKEQSTLGKDLRKRETRNLLRRGGYGMLYAANREYSMAMSEEINEATKSETISSSTRDIMNELERYHLEDPNNRKAFNEMEKGGNKGEYWKIVDSIEKNPKLIKYARQKDALQERQLALNYDKMLLLEKNKDKLIEVIKRTLDSRGFEIDEESIEREINNLRNGINERETRLDKDFEKLQKNIDRMDSPLTMIKELLVNPVSSIEETHEHAKSEYFDKTPDSSVEETRKRMTNKSEYYENMREKGE